MQEEGFDEIEEGDVFHIHDEFIARTKEDEDLRNKLLSYGIALTTLKAAMGNPDKEPKLPAKGETPAKKLKFDATHGEQENIKPGSNTDQQFTCIPYI